MAADLLHKQLLDNLRTAVLLLDKKLCVRYLNSAAEALLSTSANRLLGMCLVDSFGFDDDTRHALDKCIADGQPFTCREARLHPSGSDEISVDYSVSRVAEDGQEAALLIELHPLDRLLRITQEDALMHSHQAARALVRGVAHEIKNPLGGIRGAAQLLERALPNAELAEYTRVIIDEADRLRSIADHMLGPRQLPRFSKVNLHECLEHVRQLLVAEYGDDITIERDYDPSLPELPADRDQLIQVLLNLARNALQAVTEANTAAAVIRLRSRVLRQFTIAGQLHRLVAQIEIEDNGPGVPESLQGILFFPMISGRANGSGLGLSISQVIISHHGGLIECESCSGNTLFRVLLPIEHMANEVEDGS